jgi:hypothetical protein
MLHGECGRVESGRILGPRDEGLFFRWTRFAGGAIIFNPLPAKRASDGETGFRRLRIRVALLSRLLRIRFRGLLGSSTFCCFDRGLLFDR